MGNPQGIVSRFMEDEPYMTQFLVSSCTSRPMTLKQQHAVGLALAKKQIRVAGYKLTKTLILHSVACFSVQLRNWITSTAPVSCMIACRMNMKHSQVLFELLLIPLLFSRKRMKLQQSSPNLFHKQLHASKQQKQLMMRSGSSELETIWQRGEKSSSNYLKHCWRILRTVILKCCVDLCKCGWTLEI